MVALKKMGNWLIYDFDSLATKPGEKSETAAKKARFRPEISSVRILNILLY